MLLCLSKVMPNYSFFYLNLEPALSKGPFISTNLIWQSQQSTLTPLLCFWAYGRLLATPRSFQEYLLLLYHLTDLKIQINNNLAYQKCYNVTVDSQVLGLLHIQLRVKISDNNFEWHFDDYYH